MSLLRTLAHLMLALALLAGGLAPGLARAGEPMGDTAAASPCHDMPGDPIAPPADDCCDDGNCACDCLQHATAGFVVAPPLPRPMLRGVDAAPPAGVLPLASAAPDIRPPIA